MTVGPSAVDRTFVGIVTPYDFALDRELWRWVPDSVDLLLTRTPYEDVRVSVEQARRIGDPVVVTAAARTLVAPGPDVLAYACTAGSFVAGLDGERALLDGLCAVGTCAAVTTSGAAVRALTALDASRVAVATPYDDAVTSLLVSFLRESGIGVTGTSNLGLDGAIWTVPLETTSELVRRAWTEDCDAVFVSCTNLSTYDAIAPLEVELGVPVVTANQATMWAAVALAGRTAHGPGQRLMGTGLP